MRVVCRADASYFLGIGHVMRLLTLASALRKLGGDALFVTRNHPGHLAHVIKDRGFDCQLLEVNQDTILGADMVGDAEATQAAANEFETDWVFVDHYGTDENWEARQTHPVLALEDLFTRRHTCDILVNQNLGAKTESYATLVSASTTCLMGPDYALLRPEFGNLRPQALARRRQRNVREVLISMGGTDQPNATGWVLEVLAKIGIPQDLHLTIVMGPTAPHLVEIQAQAAAMPCPATVVAGSNQMGQLMMDADIAVGASGSTSWERCTLGLPTIMVVLAENQRDIGLALHQAGAARTLDVGQSDALSRNLQDLLFNPGIRLEMEKAAAKITDGTGVGRVIDALFQHQYLGLK